MVITERDRQIIEILSNFRFMLGRQIKILTGFTGTRATDRRLKLLIEDGYIQRKKYLYGIAGLYQITEKARKIFDVELPISKIRVEQIEHDIAVVDTIIYYVKNNEIPLSHIKTEKQSRHEKGFVTRGHEPDFTFKQDNKAICVEIELNLKSKDRFIDIVKKNYTNYDTQIWIIPESKPKIKETLIKHNSLYPNIEIIELGIIQNFIKSF